MKSEMRATMQGGEQVSVAVSSQGAEPRLRIQLGNLTREGNGPAKITALRGGAQHPALTPRELQVLKLIVQGRHNRQIATMIRRSIKTVEKHRQRLHVKLSTHEVAGLTRQALALGLLEQPSQSGRGPAKEATRLTPRELEVLRMVAQGAGNKSIASDLQRSIKTVDHHRENIMRKLGIHEVAGLTRYALALGLL